MSSMSGRVITFTPKSTQSPEISLRRNLMRSDLGRTNSLSAANNLVASVVGGEKPRNTSEARPSRAEKCFRGMLDIFQGPAAAPRTAQLRTNRDQTRSAPVGVMLFAQISIRDPLGPHRPSRSNPSGDPYPEPLGTKVARLPSVTSPPMLHSAFSWEGRLGHLRSTGTLEASEKTPACSAEIQIKEVLLEYVYGKIRACSVDRLRHRDNGEMGEGESQWLTSVITCLNHISFDTRFKVSIYLPLLFLRESLKLNTAL